MSRRRRATTFLGGTALAMGLVAGPAPAATAATPPCPPLEALVSDGVSGPAPGNGEVIRLVPGAAQSTLTTSSTPPGRPTLDSPDDMAFDLNGNILTADEGITTGVSQVVRVDGLGGARLLVSGPGVGSGPALDGPTSIAVEPTGDILVLDFVPGTADRRLVRIALTGARSVLTSPRVGGGAALGDPDRVRVVGGTIYLVGRGGVLSVDPGTGRRGLVSGSARGAGPGFALPTSLTSDATASSIVVLDQTAGGAGELIRVDLATGDRSVLSSNTAPTGTPLFDGPYDVVRDACTNTFYVLHSASAAALGEVVTVDGATGVRNLFGTYTAAGPPSNYSLLVRPA